MASIPYSSAAPAVREERLLDMWGLSAPHRFRVGYFDSAGRYISSRYAADVEACEHFAEQVRLRHPEATVYVEAIPAGCELLAFEPPRFPNLLAERAALNSSAPLAVAAAAQ